MVEKLPWHSKSLINPTYLQYIESFDEYDKEYSDELDEEYS